MREYTYTITLKVVVPEMVARNLPEAIEMAIEEARSGGYGLDWKVEDVSSNEDWEGWDRRYGS